MSHDPMEPFEPFDPDAYGVEDFGPNHDLELTEADRAELDAQDYSPLEVFGDIAPPEPPADIWSDDGRGDLPGAQSLLQGLNPRQAEAVQLHDGPLMVVAGAGTGKTRVLTRRIAHLVASGTTKPDRILGVTFTNKAAREMIDRVAELIGTQGRQVTLGSFHAVSMMILRRHAVAAGLAAPEFQVLDEDEQRTLIEQAMREAGVDDPEAPAKKRRAQAKALHARVMAFKEEGWDLAEAAERFEPEGPAEAHAIEVYRLYEAALARRNAVDFPDLILKTVKLFDSRPDIKRIWTARFSYVLVDEFQDTNALQYRWLEHLAREHANLCVVGDPDQALYQWRGARPEILNNFAADWPGCRVVVLETNYRSTEPILKIANKVVEQNPRPAPKELSSGRGGAEIELKIYTTQYEEAEEVAQAVRRHLAAGVPAREIALLFRSARPMLSFEQALNQHGIEHEIVGGMKFFQREEVKDIHAYMRLAVDLADDLAFTRVVNKPLRKLGDKTAEQIVAVLPVTGNLPDACRQIADSGQRVTRQARENLPQLAELLEHLHQSAQGMKPGELIREILARTDYIAWRRDGLADPSWRERQDMLTDLARNADTHRSAASYLQQVALASAADQASAADRVRLSTVHAAKGLEFDVVFTPAMEEGVLPNMAALQQDYGLAEERRIAHVAWTRAKRELIVSYALSRWGQPAEPSRFLVDSELLDASLAGAAAPMPERRRDQMKPAKTAVTGFHRLPRRKRA